MEILDLYNDLGEAVGETIVRGEKTDKGKNIMLSVIFIKDSEGRYLIQKTSKEKGSRFSTTGGHVLYNETSKEAIIREVKEELNLDISNENITYIGSILFGIPFGDIYYLEKDIDISSLKLQTEEVESVSYLSENEILNLIEKEQITKSHGLMFKKLLEEIK